MRKFYYSLAILILIIFSCEKPTEFPMEQDVIFKTSTNSTGFKSSCDDIAHFALITIDDITYTVDVFYLNGIIYTNSMKLESGDHTLNMFILVNDGGSPDDPEGDFTILAAPEAGSTYANFVSKPMPYDFTIDAFFKKEISLQLLCFEPSDYENFGFTWFTFEKIIPREVCFYGESCVDNIDGQPATFRVDVYRYNDLVISYNNEESLGAPLCVKYPDYVDVVDNFEFQIWVLGENGYEFFKAYRTTDDVPLPNLENNVLNFVSSLCAQTYSGCETAFAYDDGNEECFEYIPYITSTNWGWSNGPYVQSETSYTMDLYAGAGQCDIGKGYFVGNLVLTYYNDHVTVTYNLDPGYEFTDIHLYVGYLQYQDGNPTVAPGQYPYKFEDAGTNTHTFDLPEVFTGQIYIIAHSEVCSNN